MKEAHKDEVEIHKKKFKSQDKQNELQEPLSLADKRKALESEWMKVIKSGKPSSVDYENKKEVRRLAELKTYIEEEYDKLLHRRERLQQELQSDSRCGYRQSPVLPDITQCQPVTRQLLSYQDSYPAEDLSSVTHAYKVTRKV